MFLSRTLLKNKKTLLLTTSALVLTSVYITTRPTLFAIGSSPSKQMSSDSFPKGKTEAGKFTLHIQD